MASSKHKCYSSDGEWCGSCEGSFTDASCCSVFFQTYTPEDGGMARTSCISSSTSNPKLGDGIEIAVMTSTNMTGADGSKTSEKGVEGIFGRVLVPFMLLGLAIYVSIKVLEKNLPALK
jgi:hypothetical protein